MPYVYKTHSSQVETRHNVNCTYMVIYIYRQNMHAYAELCTHTHQNLYSANVHVITISIVLMFSALQTVIFLW